MTAETRTRRRSAEQQSADGLPASNGVLRASPRVRHGPQNGRHHGQSAFFGQSAASARERKRANIITRVSVGALLIGFFLAVLWAGHIYIFLLIVAIQILLFKELVSVRYRAATEKRMPLFRTLQWSWFTVAMIYAHADSIVNTLRDQDMMTANEDDLSGKSVMLGGFSLFTAVFVLSVLTLRPGSYKYQVGQLAWTVVIIVIIVGQLKASAPNIFSGIFWFAFPAACIIINDIMAYACGMTFGRRFIHRPFLHLSPNKTWEGFIGAFICTLFFAYWCSSFLSRFRYFTCTYKQLRPGKDFSWQELIPGTTMRQAMFSHNHAMPSRVFTDTRVQIPTFLRRVTRIESLPIKPIQLHGLVIAVYGSLVAPFGGFLMSGIKRAYGKKDFNTLIPGHGGVTDRMDCQLVMILFTFVHYQAFIRRIPLTCERVWESVRHLSLEDQERLALQLNSLLNYTDPSQA